MELGPEDVSLLEACMYMYMYMYMTCNTCSIGIFKSVKTLSKTVYFFSIFLPPSNFSLFLRRSESPSPPPSYPAVTGYQFPDSSDEEEERVMDETERQALQEAEDERLARELEEKERKRLLAAVSV